ncbi:MAG: 1-acyl-sn-glycerol-3-phosphate acyltransferase [Gammaproteobacteria bacterium]|nr:1-acyl-sn-glycerol-3-phosphate acyltransferase [Gammaproteobacteria bacterium]
MKANIFQKYWMIGRSLWVILSVSIIVVIKNFLGKLSRKEVDRLLYQWAVDILKIAKVSYRVINPHHFRFDPKRHYIIISNHASHYDIPLMIASFPKSIRMMAKSELFKVPIWGRAMRTAEMIPVNRSNAKKALSDLKYAKEKIENGIRIWIAPEGTRTRTGELGAFKKGAFVLAQQTNAVIVPIAICGSGKILPPKTLDFCLNQKVAIHIAKPIDSAKYAPSERQKLMDDVRNSIESLLQ